MTCQYNGSIYNSRYFLINLIKYILVLCIETFWNKYILIITCMDKLWCAVKADFFNSVTNKLLFSINYYYYFKTFESTLFFSILSLTTKQKLRSSFNECAGNNAEILFEVVWVVINNMILLDFTRLKYLFVY